ncbi:12968_t:CDS:2, partial [Acaulospora colombiana]
LDESPGSRQQWASGDGSLMNRYSNVLRRYLYISYRYVYNNLKSRDLPSTDRYRLEPLRRLLLVDQDCLLHLAPILYHRHLSCPIKCEVQNSSVPHFFFLSDSRIKVSNPVFWEPVLNTSTQQALSTPGPIPNTNALAMQQECKLSEGFRGYITQTASVGVVRLLSFIFKDRSDLELMRWRISIY